MLLLWILVLVIGVAWLAHRRIAPLPILGIVAVYLIAMGRFGHAPGSLMLVLWVLLAVVAAALLLPDLRRKLLQSISEAAATASGWSNRQPAFYPKWVEKVETTALPN